IGKDGSIFDIAWPTFDESALVKDEVEVVVQVNGKVRGKLSVAANISREDMQEAAMNDEKIKALVEGKTIVKVVAVPKKLVNIVVK
ncbi:MAG: leucine--tRNA ligase, partial [Peptostreptococcaceae bacterium]